MRMQKFVFINFTFIAFLAISACAPTVRLSSVFSDRKLQTVIVLPATGPADVTREKIDTIRRTLISELKSSGFVILDDALVFANCTNLGCKDAKQFASRYGAQAFAALSVSSANRVNVLAGYYNSISGKLELKDGAGVEIGSVEHTEREKGGLLFNSGQLIEGLRSTAANGEAESFARLSERFAKELVQQLPKPSSVSQTSSAATVQIDGIKANTKGAGRYEICALGTAGGVGSLVVDGQRSSLRESRAGNYCGVFRIGGNLNPTSRLSVEIRSPYGAVAEREISDQISAGCFPEGLVMQSADGVVNISCNGASDAAACNAKLAACRAGKVLVFKGSDESGPFERVGLIGANRLKANGVVSVLALSQDGSSSAPVTLGEKR